MCKPGFTVEKWHKYPRKWYLRRGIIQARRMMVIYCYDPQELILCLECGEYKKSTRYMERVTSRHKFPPLKRGHCQVRGKRRTSEPCWDCRNQKKKNRHEPKRKEGPEYPFESIIWKNFDGSPDAKHMAYYAIPGIGYRFQIREANLPEHKKGLPASYPIW